MKIKNLLMKNMSKVVNTLALALVVQTASSACIWLTYQPKFPEEANKYKKVM